jgi:hypothetical protein
VWLQRRMQFLLSKSTIAEMKTTSH